MVKHLTVLLPYFLLSFSNPHSIHWSSKGNYLVDENGNPTHIDGHPKLLCYQPRDVLGRFVRADGSTIYLKVDSHRVELKKPVCDVLDDNWEEQD